MISKQENQTYIRILNLSQKYSRDMKFVVFLHSTFTFLFVVSKMIVPIHYVKVERKVSQCNGFQMVLE